MVEVEVLHIQHGQVQPVRVLVVAMLVAVQDTILVLLEPTVVEQIMATQQHILVADIGERGGVD